MSKYIDADELMKYLDELRRDATEPHLTPQAVSPAMVQINAYDDCKRIVARMPAADVEPVMHGKWTKDRCSVCGAVIATDSLFDYLDENDQGFCYSCGAKMVGGSE